MQLTNDALIVNWFFQEPAFLYLFLLVVLFACIEIGRWLGDRRIKRTGDATAGGTAAIDGALFGLLGLPLAFTFSGAASRFDARRDLMVAEANAVGTAKLRLDIAPESAQPALRSAFARYVESRVAVDASFKTPDLYPSRLKESAKIQRELWKLAVAAGRQPDAQPATNTQLLPALNEMIDITSTRALATQMHPPLVLYAMLFVLAASGALLAGHGLSGTPRRNWLHPLLFAVIMAAALYVIVDMEFPRFGFIRVDSFERAVLDLTDAE
jgi:hypothetical protein